MPGRSGFAINLRKLLLVLSHISFLREGSCPFSNAVTVTSTVSLYDVLAASDAVKLGLSVLKFGKSLLLDRDELLFGNGGKFHR